MIISLDVVGVSGSYILINKQINKYNVLIAAKIHGFKYPNGLVDYIKKYGRASNTLP